MSVESFKAWKAKFDKKQADRKSKEEEERLKGLTAKEREEYKRMNTRLSGELHTISLCNWVTRGSQVDNFSSATGIWMKRLCWRKAPYQST